MLNASSFCLKFQNAANLSSSRYECKNYMGLHLILVTLLIGVMPNYMPYTLCFCHEITYFPPSLFEVLHC